MKAVQVGILAALLLCAGLLFKVYRQQQAQPPAPAQAAAPATPSTPAPPPSAATEPATSGPAASTPAEPAPKSDAGAKPARKKPAPWRNASREAPPPATVAENRPPEMTPPAPQEPAATQPSPAAQAAPPPPAADQQAPVTLPDSAPALPPEPRQPRHATIPAGTLLTVRLGETLSSAKNQPGDTFTATLDQPLVIEGLAIAERGARVEGKLVDVQQAGHVTGLASLGLQLTKLHTSDGQVVPISTASFAKEGESPKGAAATKVGIGAALGAAIGAIAGGGKGAAIGAGVGGAAGGGAVAATRGKPVEIPVETRLTFKLAEAVVLTEHIR